MRPRASMVVTIVVVAVMMVLVGNRLTSVQGQAKPEARFAAVPGEKGGQDMFGAYDIVPNWPKPLASLPGHEKWTWGAGQSVFAESPNRVFILQRGELPNIERPKQIKLPQLGPNIEFPIGRLPFRDATSTSPPGRLETPAGKVGDDSDVGQAGVDYRWEHIIVVVDANGNMIEDWTQWDKMFRRPHAIYISPYDPEKNVWVVDDYKQGIFKLSNDGKKLLQTIGTPDQAGADETHFNRPTFLTWLPDGTMYVADGYNGTRVVKLDKNGKFLLAWGEKGNPPKETRPGYMNVVHGIAADSVSRHVYVVDRSNHR